MKLMHSSPVDRITLTCGLSCFLSLKEVVTGILIETQLVDNCRMVLIIAGDNSQTCGENIVFCMEIRMSLQNYRCICVSGKLVRRLTVTFKQIIFQSRRRGEGCMTPAFCNGGVDMWKGCVWNSPCSLYTISRCNVVPTHTVMSICHAFFQQFNILFSMNFSYWWHFIPCPFLWIVCQ